MKNDMTGQRFGILTAIAPTVRVLSSGRKMPAWTMRCDCGTEIVRMTVNLKKGKHKSCGCVPRKTNENAATKLPEYRVYRQMLDRCYLTSAKNFAWYGARGIAVCDRWRFGADGKTGFECFISDMSRRPSGMTLDRINNDGDYSPDNCRWATRDQQAANRRNNRRIRVNGYDKTLSEWSRVSGASTATIAERIERGWDLEKAVTTPPLETWDRTPGVVMHLGAQEHAD